MTGTTSSSLNDLIHPAPGFYLGDGVTDFLGKLFEDEAFEAEPEPPTASVVDTTILVKQARATLSDQPLDDKDAVALHQKNLLSFLAQQKWGHFCSKHASEFSLAAAAAETIITTFDTQQVVLSTTVAGAIGSGIMLFDSAIALSEAVRLCHLEDHHWARNYAKASLNALNGLQLAAFSFDPSFAAASFASGVLFEIGITMIELDLAVKLLNFDFWLKDQLDALDYFKKRIAEVKIAYDRDQEAHDAKYQTLVNQYNDTLFNIEARVRVHRASLGESEKASFDKVLQQRCVNPRMNSHGFDRWLEEKITELRAADRYLFRYKNVASSEFHDQVQARNELLLTIQHRCQAYDQVTDSRNPKVEKALTRLEQSFTCRADDQLTEIDSISFDRHATSQPVINPYGEPSNKDRAQDQRIQTELNNFYEVQKELLRIKRRTFVSLGCLIVVSAHLSMICPPAAIAVGAIGLYYLYSNYKKQVGRYKKHTNELPKSLQKIEVYQPIKPPLTIGYEYLFPPNKTNSQVQGSQGKSAAAHLFPVITNIASLIPSLSVSAAAG